jgi:hypothetical protein
VRDDFGVVQLLEQKPFSYFPRWFTSSWMDEIWGYVPDEVRPFPALSYQVTALGGSASPRYHHVLNILIHAANGLLVLAIARRAAGLSTAAAAFAALVFVLLPVHSESVAWMTGRVDSMPALFYLAAFLAYVKFRQEGSRWSYGWSIALFFVALFTKQNTITMVATLAGYDLLVARRKLLPLTSLVLPYVPFALLTAGYLGLRYRLFGQVAREGALNARGLEDFGVILGRHTRHVVAGDMQASAIAVAVALAAVVVAWLVFRSARGGTADEGLRLLYFGPAWWAIGVLPIAVAGYHSPRHVYIAAAGWAIVLGIVLDAAWLARAGRAWKRSVAGAAALVLVLYAVPLAAAIRGWRTMAAVSESVARDVRDAASGAPERSLVIVGAPPRSWEWALPFAVRAPFQPTDLGARVFIISPRALACCSVAWFEETRRALRAWSAGPAAGSAIALRWDPESGALFRASAEESPQVASLARSLLEMSQPDELDGNLRRMLEVLPVRVR